ncbi:hypothetical protein N7462_005337 [Penicillium macrosclerotiorum]|uniref:uncharacterized protein n=1 Tax=Penicillium macrosclerotiorum TaxID=303699 RepID=UPI002547E00E|nr:uncharacterized protein N7462_005337 [Penicillium macrosclerotiorum]KAJ5682172.1 hypothetical protein N7462_005337 [Penicillium macrosclerotiorum]
MPLSKKSQMLIPEPTHKILEDLNLPSDFLSSDSSLSDPPSDFELDDRTQSCPPVNQSPSKLTCSLSSESSLDPSIPEKTPKKRSTAVIHSESPVPPPPKLPKRIMSSISPIDAPFFGLIQEQLAHDPFQLLIATIFLNRTRGAVALPVLFTILERYPTIDAMAAADLTEFVAMIHCLGFQNQRAKKCIAIARIWQTNPPVLGKRYRKLHYPRKLDGRDVPAGESIDDEDHRTAWEIAHLPGVGAYSLDSWRIFCRDELRGLTTDWKGTGATVRGFVPEWKSVLPEDKELRAYLTWMWLKEGWIWDCHTGDLTPAGAKTLRAAQNEGIAHEQNGNWVLGTSPMKKAPNGLHTMD